MANNIYKGIARGVCSVKNCECTEYFLPTEDGTVKCQSCDHVPLKHKKLTDNLINSNVEEPTSIRDKNAIGIPIPEPIDTLSKQMCMRIKTLPKPIPYFTGKENLQKFLDSLAEVVQIKNNPEEYLILLKSYLSGPAKEWYKTLQYEWNPNKNGIAKAIEDIAKRYPQTPVELLAVEFLNKKLKHPGAYPRWFDKFSFYAQTLQLTEKARSSFLIKACSETLNLDEKTLAPFSHEVLLTKLEKKAKKLSVNPTQKPTSTPHPKESRANITPKAPRSISKACRFGEKCNNIINCPFQHYSSQVQTSDIPNKPNLENLTETGENMNIQTDEKTISTQNKETTKSTQSATTIKTQSAADIKTAIKEYTPISTSLKKEMEEITALLQTLSSKGLPIPSSCRPIEIEVDQDELANYLKHPDKFIVSRPPAALAKERDQMHQDLLKNGLIRPAQGLFPSSRCNYVVKPNGLLRWTIDYYRKNRFVKRKNFPLPITHDTLEKISGKKIYSIIDLKVGFWQILLSELSKKYTSFATPDGPFEWNVLPQGLNIGSEEFQSRMLEVFGNIANVNVFIDDLIISSNTIEEHIEALNKIYSKAKIFNITFNMEKMHLFKTEIHALGHIVSEEGYKITEESKRAILDMRKPETITELKSALSLFSFFRGFIHKLGKICHPLYLMTHEDKPKKLNWDNTTNEAWKKIIDQFIETPPLVKFDPDAPCYLETDGSGLGWGAVLYQDHGVIKFASGGYNKQSIKYKSTKGELYALKLALTKFRHYLLGKDFTWYTDCKPLVPLENVQGDPKNVMTTWIHDIMSEFSFKAVHKPGVDMISDPLSRLQKENIDTSDPNDNEEIDNNMKTDPNSQDEDDISDQQNTTIQHENMNQEKDKVDEVDMSRTQIIDIIKEIHLKQGHLGITKLTNIIKEKVRGPFIEKMIHDIIGKCDLCQKYKVRKENPIAPRSLHATRPFQIVALDLLIESKTKRGFKYAIIVIDIFTRYVRIIPIMDARANTMTTAIDRHWMSIFPVPEEMFADCGSIYTSKEFEDFCNSYAIKKKIAAPRMQSSNGICERNWATIKTILNTMQIENPMKEWDQLIHSAVNTYNNTTHSATGYSPSQAIFGIKQNISDQIFNKHIDQHNAILNNILNTAEAKKNLENKENRLEYKFSVGDKVLIKNTIKKSQFSTKNRPNYIGPFILISCIGHSARLWKISNGSCQHVKNIVPYREPSHDDV